MNKERILEWGTIVGLATGIVGLGTALVNSNDARHKAEEKVTADRQTYDHDADLQRRAFEGEQRELAAQAHLRSCELHNRSIAATNDDFDDLYREHGQLMSFMRSCLQNKAGQDQQHCLVVVCGAAAIFASSNCLEVASRASSLAEKVNTESSLAKADQCDVPSSAASSFFDVPQVAVQQGSNPP